MTIEQIIRRLKHGVNWRWLELKGKIRAHAALWATRWRWAHPAQQKPHGLPGELIVSLTSYPPRFPTLLPTLQCLLRQSVRPDRVILWIDKGATDKLPAEIKALTAHGLTIAETTSDIAPYKKIIPTLKQFPDAFIATADDDIYYRPTWLEELIKAWDGSVKSIVCHRAHRIRCTPNGLPLPYGQWQHEVPGPLVAHDILPTGVCGILYPPASLAPEVLDEEKFQRLCARADDIWLYWMGQKAGSQYIKTPRNLEITLWPGSQETALMNENVHSGGNDTKINALIDALGWPLLEKAA